MRRLSLFLGLCALAVVPLISSCAGRGVDRCYLPMARYEPLKEVFQETGSMQRVEEIMEEEEWAKCERNQFRYYLTRDLYLESLERELMTRPTGGQNFVSLEPSS